jgi:hypothetical protein
MSFGISVSDFITVGKLIIDITSSLRNVGGSKSDYQELLRELECLHCALRHLDKLHQNGSSSTTLDSIKYAALSCRRPLEEFLCKVKKYEKTLGVRAKGGPLAGITDKVTWTFKQKDEVYKLQGYLNVHVGTINMLLAEHGLEKMDLVSDKAAADLLQIREKLDQTCGIITQIKDGVTTQALTVTATKSIIERLVKMISGEFRTSLKSLGEMVAQVWYGSFHLRSAFVY